MDILTTYKIFLIKTLKEKRYYWTRNIFFVLFPLLFIIIYIFSGATENPENIHNEQARTYPSLSEVSYTKIPHPIRLQVLNIDQAEFIFLSRSTTSFLGGTFR